MVKVKSWKDLTLREKIGQTMTLQSTEIVKKIEEMGSPEAFFSKYPIGGLFNNSGMVKGLDMGFEEKMAENTKAYNRHLRVPLVGVGDYGAHSRDGEIGLPSQMALGATNDEALAYRAGEYMAEDFKSAGIHWGLSPVCDLIAGMHSQTNTRAVGEDPESCIRFCKAELKAMRDKNVIACIKHFPGRYEASSFMDAHIARTDNETPLEVWWNTCGRVYKELIEAGAPTIMTGHNNLVSYQTEKLDGQYPPATMSQELVTKLLRQELGFQGVVITDALNMGAFGGSHAIENSIRSFLAGNDMLLWPKCEYLDEMERRILSGEIDEAVLDASVERIWKLKEEYGILEGQALEGRNDDGFYLDIARTIDQKSLTLVNNFGGLIPLDPARVKKVLVVGVTPNDGQYNAMCALKEELEKYGCQVDMQRNIWIDETERRMGDYDLLLFALCRTVHKPIGPLDFWGREAYSVWASNIADISKTVVVSFGSPFLYRYYRTSGVTYVNAYDCYRHTVEAVVRGLFGENTLPGKANVRLWNP